MTEERVIKSHLGVYAFIFNENNLLLIKKARGPYTGEYDLPGGTIEPNELIEETLAREIKEETSCDLLQCAQLCTLDARFDWDRKEEGKPDAVFKHIGIIYMATVKGEPSIKGDGLDSAGAEWIPISDIVEKKVVVTPFVERGLSYISANMKE